MGTETTIISNDKLSISLYCNSVVVDLLINMRP